MKELGPLLWALFITCLILALAYWFTRYVVGNMAMGRLARGRRMEVLEQVPVGKDQRLMLVKVGERLYLLGAAPGGFTNLGEIPRELLDQQQTDQPDIPPAGGLPESFAQALRRVLEQRKR